MLSEYFLAEFEIEKENLSYFLDICWLNWFVMNIKFTLPQGGLES